MRGCRLGKYTFSCTALTSFDSFGLRKSGDCFPQLGRRLTHDSGLGLLRSRLRAASGVDEDLELKEGALVHRNKRGEGQENTGRRSVIWDGLEEYRPALTSFLSRHSHDEGELEDLVQETILKAARFQWSMRDRSRMRAWIMRVARNVERDHVRRSRREMLTCTEEKMLVPDSVQEGVNSTAEPTRYYDVGDVGRVRDDVFERCLAQSLAGLRPKDRELLELFYWKGQSPKEIASVEGLGSEVVKVRLFRARGRLRKALRLRLHQQEQTCDSVFAS